MIDQLNCLAGSACFNLMHESHEVVLKAAIMHKLKVSALCSQEHYFMTLVHAH